jgi:hypothetical protein
MLIIGELGPEALPSHCSRDTGETSQVKIQKALCRGPWSLGLTSTVCDKTRGFFTKPCPCFPLYNSTYMCMNQRGVVQTGGNMLLGWLIRVVEILYPRYDLP